MRVSEVSPVHELSGRRAQLKGTYGGKALAALYRQRQAPGQALRAARARRRDTHPRRCESARREFRGIYLLPAGPGNWPALRDTIESILHWDGDDTKVVVIDDATVDCRQAIVQAHFPQVDVLRRVWPTGGPPRLFPMIASSIRKLLRRYRFDVLCKLDTDALVTGRGAVARVAATFAESPKIGMLGTMGLRADGVAEDWQGFLEWRQPWWSVLGEDHCFSLALLASGWNLGSFGGPTELTVSGQSHLPIDKEDVVRLEKLAIHSVRRGNRGEPEAELRRFFRALREA